MELTPTRLHGESIGVNPDPKPLSIEDAVMNQIDRIGYLRSVGLPWSEPVFHLRDLLVGLEDDEFWDGIPKSVRNKVTDTERALYNERGWDTMHVRMRVDSQGNESMDPTPSELSLMVRIFLGLLARRGTTWRRQSVDKVVVNFND